MNDLERSYRRLLHLHPRSWRERREEEVLAVLLEVAAPDQARPTPAERGDLLRSAAREHTRATARAARRAPGRAAALAVLLVGTTVVLVPTGGPDQARPTALPEELPAYSYVTQSVSTSPPGPALAVYRQGTGAELLDLPQAVVVGAGGAVRRLDLAEGRNAHLQGSPSSFLLSPDGTRVASGRYDTRGHADIALQDLRTGEVSTTTDLGYPSAHPVAWSPDGRSVLASLTALPWLAPQDQPVEVGPDRLVLVGLDGTLLPLPVGVPADGGQVAWSPDGRSIAVWTREQELVVVDASTGARSSLGTSRGLAGVQPWSPDGALLATSGACSPEGQVGQSFYDVVVVPTDPAGPLPTGAGTCLSEGGTTSQLVGWAAPHVPVFGVTDDDGAQSVVAVDLGDGTRTEVAGVPTGSGNYAVGDLQVPQAALAGSLAPDRAAPLLWDRGPRSDWPGVVLASGVVGVLVALAAAVGRRVGSRLGQRSGPGAV